MKKVTTPENVAHLFANKLQAEARTPNNNMYFYNENIYSYGNHFVIAKHVTNEQGNAALLFTERGYSNTTAKHKQIVGRACNHLNIIFVCDPSNSHAANFEKWSKDAENIARNLVTAKKPEKYINEIKAIEDRVSKYAQFYGLNLPKFLIDTFSITSKDDFLTFRDAAEKRAKEKLKEEQKELKKKIQKDLKKFRNFEISTIYGRLDFDFLRYNKETNEIETSQRVNIKADICKRFYVNHIKTLNECKECNIKLIDFEVKEINKKFIQIGCHKIELKEISKIAKLLNW